MGKENKSHKKESPAIVVCRECGQGACCRDGVEADLFEVARILEESLDISRPWFQYLGRDKRFPSGFKFTTLVRHRRCIFQNAQKRCMIYAIRPRFCEEFPLENGKKAPYYHKLCYHGEKRGKKCSKR